jgi:hypothetical protein
MIHLSHSDLAAVHNSESAKSIVLNFLKNAGTWRGETAKTVKEELKRRLRLTGYKI